MTQEEKAKRYDEAIEIAKKINNEQRAQPFNVMTRVFPELKESENEKIRKWLIRTLKSLISSSVQIDGAYEMMLPAIAWLEKQGSEHIEINPSEFDSRLNRLLKQFESLSKEELASSLSFYLNVVQNDGTYKSDEKQGEQKPVEPITDGLNTEFQKQVSHLIASAINREHEYTKGYVEWVAQSLLGYAKNELGVEAWSEADENMFERITGELKEKQIIGVLSKSSFNTMINWLKFLKYRILPQPKQEWSEVEKVMFRNILNHYALIEDLTDCNGIPKEQYINFINSLRPQKQWKPSEEQIIDLENTIDNFIPPSYKEIRVSLQKLLIQLKAL